MMLSLCIISLSMAYDPKLSLYITSCNQGVLNHTLWYIKTCSHGVSYHVIFSVSFHLTIFCVLLYHLSLYIASMLAVFNLMLSWCVIALYPNTWHYFLRSIIVSAIAYQIIFSWYVTSWWITSCCHVVLTYVIMVYYVCMLSCYRAIMLPWWSCYHIIL